MRRKFFGKYLPEPHEVLAKKWAAPFRPWLGHPNLWHLNRHSVPGAVAIGLFCGLIPGPVQMLGALLCAIPLRKNVPVALAVTLYTNPLTIVPLYLIAYAYGAVILGYRALTRRSCPSSGTGRCMPSGTGCWASESRWASACSPSLSRSRCSAISSPSSRGAPMSSGRGAGVQHAVA